MTESGKNDKKLEHHDKTSFISILSSLAAVEGTFNKEEQEFLKKIAREWSIKEEQLEEIFSAAPSEDLTIAEDEEERIDQLAALIGMMMVDGKIFDEEFQFCSMIAKKFGFKKGIVNDIITDILENL
ncbi:MAG: TerB family tellurite resistance protein [Candidatus Latescibacteria bacterium]|nr:TerB family tellurite resistance protein [Candidatus Latescibacterota bacterium]